VIGVPTVIYSIVVLVLMPFAGWVLYSSIKPGAYKSYYRKYLEELPFCRELVIRNEK